MKLLTSLLVAVVPLLVFGQCLEPTDLTWHCYNQLSWTENGTATTWDIEYGVCGFTPTGVPSAGYNDVTLNPLSLLVWYNVGYDFYVRSDCGSSVSDWVGPVNCQCVLRIGGLWSHGYNGQEAIVFWDTISVPTQSFGTGPEGPFSGNSYWYVESTGTANSDSAVMYSPGLNISGISEPALTFRYYLYGEDLGSTTDGGGIRVEMRSGLGDPWQVLGEVQGNRGPEWHYFAAPFTVPDTSVQFRFIAHMNSSGPTELSDIAIDDFQVVEAAGIDICPAPSNPVLTYTSESSALLSWNQDESPSLWDIDHGTCGFTTPGVPSSGFDNVSNPVPIFSLPINTEYQYYVRSDCGGTHSDWIVSGCEAFEPVGTTGPEDGNGISVFSNPTNTTIRLSGIQSHTRFRIINIQGGEMLSGAVTGNQEIDVSKLPVGLYLIELSNRNGTEAQKLMIDR